jgi:hypothetical protein
MNNNERPFPLTKDLLDTINSVSWFLMDASWMLQIREMSLVMIFPTVLSGVVLCYIEKRKNVSFINFAIMNWICMNITWMFSEIYANHTLLLISKTFLAIGIAFIALAIYSSENLTETFSHFRRFRVKKIVERNL